jgi:hypothetical protein
MFNGATVDTTAQTLAALNPVVDPPAPAPLPAPAIPGLFPSVGAAQAASSPTNPVKLAYGPWAVATIQAQPGMSPAYYLAETTQTAYQGYLFVWGICQQMRTQPGVAAQWDAQLATMAES